VHRQKNLHRSRDAANDWSKHAYDGDGSRMARVFNTGNLYWRNLGGDTLLEDSDGGTNLREYIYFNGQRVARRDVTSNTVHYIFSDHLGSTSLITDALGTMSSCNGFTSGQFESDYYPYGGEQPICANLGDQNYKFTGKERDAESGNDYFGARYYRSSLGRFMTPDWAAKPTDVPYANFGNPQSLNLYSYVENNPLTITDPDGHDGGGPGLVEDVEAGYTSLMAGYQGFLAANGLSGATVAGSSRWGLLAGPALYIGAMIHPPDVGQSDADEIAEKARLQQQNEQNQEKQVEPEPKADASGAGAGERKGGGRNAQKSNVKRASSAEKNLTKAEADLAAAKAQLPSKARSEAIKKAQKDIKHWRKKAAEKSPSHSQKHKGQQQ